MLTAIVLMSFLELTLNIPKLMKWFLSHDLHRMPRPHAPAPQAGFDQDREPDDLRGGDRRPVLRPVRKRRLAA